MDFTKDSLSIVWTFDKGQEEVPGLRLFGLWLERPPVESFEESFLNQFSVLNLGLRQCVWRYKNYTVISFDLLIKKWPSPFEWFFFLENMFNVFLDAGATVVWCGGEECLASPEILVSDEGHYLIYAIKTLETGLICNANLDEQLVFLTKDNMIHVKHAILKSGFKWSNGEYDNFN